MIDLQRLDIKVGDVVKITSSPTNGLEPIPFTVTKTEILNLVPVVYGEGVHNIPIPADELVIIEKNEEITIADKNKQALEEILQTIYPDRWDIQKATNSRDSGFNNGKTLIIHFPEIEIRNSRNNRHLIRDLYISLSLNNNYRLNATNIMGTRSTRTQEEINVSYAHSHLSAHGRAIGFSRFCTGRGIINENLLLASQANPSDDKFTYELLFESIDPFVAWESLEGGPYNRISSIGRGRRSRYSYYSSLFKWNTSEINRIKEILKLLKKYDYNIPIEWNLNGKALLNKNSLIMIDEKNLKNSLKEFIFSNLELMKEISDKLGINKVIVEEFDRRQDTIEIGYDQIVKLITDDKPKEKPKDYVTLDEGPHGLVFRGQKVINKILTKETTETKLNNLNISDSLVKTLVEHFNFKFYGKLFKEESQFLKRLTSSEA